ncbi:hypothetical protein CWI36_0219p0020 [Hamiltosporidium magnivora]|uniref:Uncharacterized protein n=1 Tax=Hamiltosporidium magnivora TaxID=148818 RepID=A0A4Q9LI55_9MICR|nr:hypothetical protein CWI36_0219p0020 [Hamiltosporidium magnivora]
MKRPDIFIFNKRENRITLIEVRIISSDSLQMVETEKLRKYGILENDLGLIYSTQEDDETILLIDEEDLSQDQMPKNAEKERQWEPTHYIKETTAIQDSVKHDKKNNGSLISYGRTLEEPTININENSNL